MLSKSLDSWIEECRTYSSLCYNRYVYSLNDPCCPKNISNIYCDIANNYWILRETLEHIKKTGNAISPQCAMCLIKGKSHQKIISDTYNKYAKWINAVAIKYQKNG